MNGVLAGRRAVLEALRARPREVTRVYLLDSGRGGTMREARSAAERAGVPVESVDRATLDGLSGGLNHQGVVALAAPPKEPGLEDVLARIAAGRWPAFIVVLDEVKDPGNAGAVVRTAECAGAHAVVITEHRSAPAGPGMSRASAGAVEHLPVVRVVNLRSALERLKEAGCWVVGADAAAGAGAGEAGGRPYTSTDFRRPVALVLGEEGKGLRELTRRTCDELVAIPMKGRVGSLNVSAAAAVLCFEVVRQRDGS